MDSLVANLEIVREKVARAAERSGRRAEDVAVVGVTKAVSVERIEEAVEAGLRQIGESRVQEAEAKFGTGAGADLRALVELHMIGALQRNKTGRAAALFDWVQSVDRPELVATLDKAVAERGRGAPMPVLLEVNVTGEPAKSGVAPDRLPALAESLALAHNLQGKGLMTIARLGAGERELRRSFALLRRLLEEVRAGYPGDWRHLSMGMTDDYTYAIEEGATMVRLGRALFGKYVLPD